MEHDKMNTVLKTTVAALAAIALGSASFAKDKPISISRQGLFSSGGTVTAPVPGEYDEKTNWLDATRKGTTPS